MFDASDIKVTRKSDDQRVFIFESTRELDTDFQTVRMFSYEGAEYTVVGTPVRIQATSPEYAFAYAVEVE
jgi:hypothetical protein